MWQARITRQQTEQRHNRFSKQRNKRGWGITELSLSSNTVRKQRQEDTDKSK